MRINQDNIFGNNTVEIKVDIDIGRLKEIIENESLRIQRIFDETVIQSNREIQNFDDNFIPIDDKNIKNDLVGYWNEFIKKHESKLKILKDFFADNDYMEKIESASDDLKEEIFAFKNKNNHLLTPEVLRFIINQHTQHFNNTDDKNIAKLIIFYLYRFCFIGEK